MKMTPELAAQIGQMQTDQFFAPIIQRNERKAAQNAVEQTALNYENFYQNEMAKMGQKYQRELDLLRDELRIAAGRLEVQKARLEVEILKNRASRYNYQIERDSLLVLLEEQFGEEFLNQMIKKLNELAVVS